MNPFQNMELHREQFTQNDTLIYQEIIKRPDQVTYKTTSQLALACGVSQPALTRFIKALGYTKYQDFRADVISYLARQKENGIDGKQKLTYFENLSLLLSEAQKLLTDEYMTDLARYFLSFPRVFASGIGKSFQPASLLQNLLRKHNIFIHAGNSEALAEIADHMEEEDLLLIFTISAQPEIMEKAVHTAGKILLITANGRHAYQTQVDRTVVLPFVTSDPEAGSVSPVLFDIFVELLDNYIARDIKRESN